MPKVFKAKKLVLVSASSASIIDINKKVKVTQAIQKGKKVILDQVSCIHYPI